jgi:hypothetical protein
MGDEAGREKKRPSGEGLGVGFRKVDRPKRWGKHEGFTRFHTA